jgi:hypothetical protein
VTASDRQNEKLPSRRGINSPRGYNHGVRALSRGALLGPLLLAACNSLVDFGELQKVPAPKATREITRSDVTPEGGTVRCDWDKPFDPPKPILGSVNSAQDDSTPSLTRDELTMFFQRSANATEASTLVVYRKSLSDPFGPPETLTLPGGQLQPPAGATITGDGLVLIFQATKVGDADNVIPPFYTAVRNDTNVRFNEPRLFEAIKGEPQSPPLLSIEAFAALTISGDEVLFSSNRAGPDGIRHLYRVKKATDGADLDGYDAKTLAPLDELNADGAQGSESGVTLSDDGLTIYFGSDRSGGKGDSDIYVAHRQTRDAKFDKASVRVVGELNSEKWDVPGWLSPDGCRLYMYSNRAVNKDIYVAERAPSSP